MLFLPLIYIKLSNDFIQVGDFKAHIANPLVSTTIRSHPHGLTLAMSSNSHYHSTTPTTPAPKAPITTPIPNLPAPLPIALVLAAAAAAPVCVPELVPFAFVSFPEYGRDSTPVPLVQSPGEAVEEKVMSAHYTYR